MNCQPYFTHNFKILALNVLSMRRSSLPYKANRRFAVGWNVGERKPHKAVGDCDFSNPEPPNRRRSAYCLLSAGFLLFILDLFDNVRI